MRATRALVMVASVGVSAGLAAGCGSDDCSSAGTCEDAPTDGGPLDATTDGASHDGTAPGDSSPQPGDAAGDASDATPPPTCDFSVDPVEALCVTDALGIFVSPTGTTGGTGTKESPVSTIAKGLALATSGTSHVYVCTGSYAENVEISATSAVSLQGGFDCSSWTYATTNKVTVAPASGIALTVNQVTSALAIEDIEFDAAAGTATSVNSIAGLVNASPSVTLRRVVLTGGFGRHAGESGGAGDELSDGADGGEEWRQRRRGRGRELREHDEQRGWGRGEKRHTLGRRDTDAYRRHGGRWRERGERCRVRLTRYGWHWGRWRQRPAAPRRCGPAACGHADVERLDGVRGNEGYERHTGSRWRRRGRWFCELRDGWRWRLGRLRRRRRCAVWAVERASRW